MSEAYIRALCAANGFSIDRSNHDNDGYDVEISCKGRIEPDSTLHSPKLDIQLKSSSSKITTHDDGSITYSLEVKNHKTLIESNRMIPQILTIIDMKKIFAIMAAVVCLWGCEKNIGYEPGSFEALANEMCGEYVLTGMHWK